MYVMYALYFCTITLTSHIGLRHFAELLLELRPREILSKPLLGPTGIFQPERLSFSQPLVGTDWVLGSF